MPTPFSHLRFAYRLLEGADLIPALGQALPAQLPAFLLGNVAPDLQTVSGQARETTHFFSVPARDHTSGEVRLFEQHPALAPAGALPLPQAMFLSGYLAHLVLDEVWIETIFEPCFGAHARWGTLPERLYLHNALRSHIDEQDRRQLPLSTAACLHTAQPQRWLPFAGDATLLHWRDLLAEQLAPGRPARTVEMFAKRMGTDPRALAALLASPEAMQRRVFARLPSGQLERYVAEAQVRCLRVLHAYWDESV